MTEEKYNFFVGIDVSKNKLDIFVLPTGEYKTCENSNKSLKQTLKELNLNIQETFILLETTGGYEYIACDTLLNLGYDLHRANTRHAKNFIRSLGQNAKTDKIDSWALATYAKERHEQLSLFNGFTKQELQLKSLMKCRNDLKQDIVKMKNRITSPSNVEANKIYKSILLKMEKEVLKLDENINKIILEDDKLKTKSEILQTFNGIGRYTANALVSQLPELGQLSRQEISALCGLAPFARDSGKMQGKRICKGGRNEVRKSLFMATMVATRTNPRIRAFYEHLIEDNHKCKMVAMTACMRKMIVILNAMIKNHQSFNPTSILTI